MSYQSIKESVKSNYSWFKHEIDSNFQYYVEQPMHSTLDRMVSLCTGKTYINGQEYIPYTPPILPRPYILKNVFEKIYHFKWSDRMDMQPDFDKLKENYPAIYANINDKHGIDMNQWTKNDYRKVSNLIHPDKLIGGATYFNLLGEYRKDFTYCKDDKFLCGKKEVGGEEKDTLKFLTKKYTVLADIYNKKNDTKENREIEEAIKYYKLVVGEIDNIQGKFAEYCAIEAHKSEILCEQTLQKHTQIFDLFSDME